MRDDSTKSTELLRVHTVKIAFFPFCCAFVVIRKEKMDNKNRGENEHCILSIIKLDVLVVIENQTDNRNRFQFATINLIDF